MMMMMMINMDVLSSYQLVPSRPTSQQSDSFANDRRLEYTLRQIIYTRLDVKKYSFSNRVELFD